MCETWPLTKLTDNKNNEMKNNVFVIFAQKDRKNGHFNKLKISVKEECSVTESS